ncbi:MAG TPA: PQQ-binding-like beta-propeller repeat protein [Chitinophaga sp.]|uniref:outer membrane protein assembly factor BamB family protein n=1 Tax=Chitinophaga sp. TaxID=1869181 RepID=UPI002DBF0AFF|nr:PQQ-binding-like beta-propeller repeat protein [Chitinophaga sp.]HEU4552237.1 PQQ-binding-like beta-propeller repeat protein [Chitinophaga sp.]
MKLTALTRLSLLVLGMAACRHTASHTDYSSWRTYAGTKDGNRYSSNDQINTGNVARLRVAWTYSSHDKDTNNHSQIQCNPIMVDSTLYGTSPRLKLFALDAATGMPRWVFDPATLEDTANADPMAFFKVSRGVMYWQSEDGSDKRILYSAGEKVYAINALTGKQITPFGDSGYINLAVNLDRDTGTYNPFVAATTPGIIYKNLMIIGMRVAESADAAPGHIRAYDVRTGKRAWIFHTIPHPGEKGYNTWEDTAAWRKFGGANSWAGMSLDENTGVLYVPTGSIGGDFYGGIRKGANLYGNSLIALDAATGKYLWHYQVVHHDLWDRDLAANPNLVTIRHDGKKIDAVAQVTKHGYIFVFDRHNGQPVFPIKETPVPANGLPGEAPWPTQPIPALPEPFARQHFDSTDVFGVTPAAYAMLMEQFRRVKYNTMFTPPGKEGGWIFPGFDGGGEWGGAAADPETGILYINSSELPWSLTMIDMPDKMSNANPEYKGKAVYGKYCVACHGPELKGNGSSYPSLVDIGKKYSVTQLQDIIAHGRNMMPAFKMDAGEKQALLAFLLHLQEKQPAIAATKKELPKEPGSTDSLRMKKSILDEVPYTMTGYNRFLDADGYPGIKPPWGTLNAVNLNTGKLLWKVPLGEYAALTKKGIPVTGTENYGGPLVTKGGIVFIAATKDEKIRAFDKATGKVLWEAPLPAAGYATPATYMAHGRQYVVIACGGGKIGSKSGDTYVAFALENGEDK